MAHDVSTLAEALGSADCAVRVEAAQRLAQLGPEAQAADLVAATADEATREWAVAALEGLGPPPPEQLSQLVELAQHRSADVAYWATTLVGRLGPTARAAAPVLVNTLRSSKAIALRQRAAWALGRIAPADAAARAALAACANADDARLARLAREALAAIDQQTGD